MSAAAPSHDLRAIAACFHVYGDFVEAGRYGGGHINDTYRAVFDQSGARMHYLFQRVNHLVFKNPHGLMENVARICRHAQAKLQEVGAPDASRRALTLVPTLDGKDWLTDAGGNVWRCYLFVEGARGVDVIETPDQAYQAARAFGAFQKLLVDLPGGRLVETIPNFHHSRMRFETFQRSLAADAHGRAASVQAEVAFFLRHKADFSVVVDHLAAGRIPERVTHNDTKLNNVLIDNRTQEGVCVIDLDTCMPGCALYDFGDMVRTSTSPAKEDEQDLSKVFLQEPYFEALARGYLSAAGDFLNPLERELLAFSGKLLTMECGMRFLTDYLEGDVYFKTHRPGQNLDRARTQIKLATDIETKMDGLNRLVATL